MVKRKLIAISLCLLVLTSCTTLKEQIKLPGEVQYTLDRTWDSVGFVAKITDSGVRIVGKVLDAVLQFGKDHPDVVNVLLGVGGGLLL